MGADGGGLSLSLAVRAHVLPWGSPDVEGEGGGWGVCCCVCTGSRQTPTPESKNVNPLTFRATSLFALITAQRVSEITAAPSRIRHRR